VTSGLLSAQFGAAAVDAQLTDEALVAAMLDVEVALARACAAADLVPAAAAEAIAAACDPARFDLTELRARVADSGNPVVPLVGQLGRYVGAEAEAWVHFGATSQDVLDTCSTRP
jgi:3-carboxy-cis,cis-muconate cycloisomerase